MKKKNSRIFIIIAAVLVLVLMVVAGTAASVYAFRQLTTSEEGAPAETALNQQAEDDSEDPWEKGVLVSGVDPESPAAFWEIGINSGGRLTTAGAGDMTLGPPASGGTIIFEWNLF